MKDNSSKEVIRDLQALIARETGAPLRNQAEEEMRLILQQAGASYPGAHEESGFVNCEVTILLADLRGFTSISATLPAGTVIAMLNRCLARMNEIISRHQGVVDKFMGDSIMVLFGAPVAQVDDAQRALTCAIEMQRAMLELNEIGRAEGLPELFMGIGVNTGSVTAGRFGSKFYSEYTVIGDEVNLASRIEAFSLRGQVLISEHTYDLCRDLVSVSDAMEVFVKGKTSPVRLRELYAIPSLGLEVPRKEARRSHRMEVKLPCSVCHVKEKIVIPQCVPAVIRDIGYHGMLLELDCPIHLLDEVKIEFEMPLIEYKAKEIYAKVLNLKQKAGRYLAGVEITSSTPETNMKIQLFVQLLVTAAA